MIESSRGRAVPALRREAIRRQDGWLVQRAAERGRSAEELRLGVQHRIEEWLAPGNSVIEIRLSSEAYEGFRRWGRWLTFWSAGGAHADHRDYLLKRGTVEKDLFGYPPETNPDLRPVYALVGDAGKPARTLAHFGELRMRLRDDVRERCTVTFADSWALQFGPCILPSPLVRPSWRSVLWAFAHVALPTDVDDLAAFSELVYDKMGEHGRWPSFVEAQVHGGVSADDVEAVFDANGERIA